MRKQSIIPFLVASLCLTGCSSATNHTADTSVESTISETKETYTCDQKDSHAIEADETDSSYENIIVEKTGDSEGDEADFTGSNAAIYATNGAVLSISDAEIKTNGIHANGVFSYGEGTTINIENSKIDTEQATSGGVMVTGGGTLNATNLTITTKSGSSAPIRSDRGGGHLNVTGGVYKSYGSGSPAIYSTADIQVKDATLYSDIAEAVVVEGKNSVTITDSDVTGKNTVHNSDKADVYRNVMIYQSMSGDSEEGKGSFTMKGGTLTSENGCMFFVTNTIADITLENVTLQSTSDDFLKIEKAGWGQDGSNGGQVTFTAKKQTLEGIITVDEISALNMYLQEGSSFQGSIASKGNVYVELEKDSTWTLTENTEINGLTCDENSIKLNGHTLTVDGKPYTEGTKSTGEAITFEVSSLNDMPQAPPEGGNMAPPEGWNMTPPNDGEKPPALPNDGNQPPEPPSNENMAPSKNGEQPPAPPDEMKDSQNPEETSEKLK